MKKIFINIFLISIVFLSSHVSRSQNNMFEEHKNTFGIKASNISGYGFAYTRNLSDNYNIQVMGLIFYQQSDKILGLVSYDDNNGVHTINNYNIGAEIQRDLYQGEYSRIYFLFGGYYYMDNDESISDIGFEDVLTHSYNVGIGIGANFFYKRFVISCDVGYKFYEDRMEVSGTDVATHPELVRLTKIGGGIGIGFMF